MSSDKMNYSTFEAVDVEFPLMSNNSFCEIMVEEKHLRNHTGKKPFAGAHCLRSDFI